MISHDAPRVETRNITVAPSRDSGLGASVSEALTLASVFRAVQVILTTIAMMRLQGYRGEALVTERPHPLLKPDTSGPLVEGLAFDLATTGNAFLSRSVTRGRYAVLPSAEVSVTDPTNDPFADPVLQWRGKDVTLDTYHLKLVRRPGILKPDGPLQACGEEVAALLRLREYAEQWTNPEGVPKGYLKSPESLNASESTAMAEGWKEFLRRHDGLAVLSRGTEYVSTLATPEQAQFMEVLNATTTNIARLFGIPAAVLLAPLDGSTETYQNLQDGNLVFLQQTLSRYMTEIERAFSWMLPNGQDARFNEDDLTRMNATLETPSNESEETPDDGTDAVPSGDDGSATD